MSKLKRPKATLHVVVNVGCICCGESTRVVGVYKDKDKADKAMKREDSKMVAKFGSNPNSHVVDVFSVPITK